MPALDGFRALAALLVVGFHLQADVLRSGSFGVDLFFVLSGFLISSALIAEHRANGALSLRKFYVRRVLRLYPALVLSVLVLIVTALVGAGNIGGYTGDVVRALTYTTNLYVGFGGHPGPLNFTWSLGVEEQFYLLWPPILAWALLHKRPGTAALVAFGVSLAGHVLAASLRPSYAAYYLPISRFDQTLAGVLLAMLVSRDDMRTRLERCTGLAPALLGLVVIVGLSLLPGDEGSARLGNSLAVTVAAVVVLAHLAVRRRGALVWAFSLPPARWIGDRSYGLYVLHLFVYGQLIPVVAGLPTSLRFLITLAAALLAAHLSFVLVERPFLRFKPYATKPSSAWVDKA